MKMNKKLSIALGAVVLAMANQGAFATCADIVSAYNANKAAVVAVVGQAGNGGYGLPMWISAVDESGKICGITNTSNKVGSDTVGNASWLGSRVISAQKANGANAFSLDAFSISSGNLQGLTREQGSLFGLQASNPVDATIAYLGNAATFGTGDDPLVGKRIGGINVFGGGLALYKAGSIKVGAIGVSGDTSCTDHAVAWKIRKILGFDYVPGGFVSGYSPTPGFAVKGDELIIKLSGNTGNTYTQPSCAHNSIQNPTPGANTGVIIDSL